MKWDDLLYEITEEYLTIEEKAQPDYRQRASGAVQFAIRCREYYIDILFPWNKPTIFLNKYITDEEIQLYLPGIKPTFGRFENWLPIYSNDIHNPNSITDIGKILHFERLCEGWWVKIMDTEDRELLFDGILNELGVEISIDAKFQTPGVWGPGDHVRTFKLGTQDFRMDFRGTALLFFQGSWLQDDWGGQAFKHYDLLKAVDVHAPDSLDKMKQAIDEQREKWEKVSKNTTS